MTGRRSLLVAYLIATGFAVYNASRAKDPPYGLPWPTPRVLLDTSLFFGVLGVAAPIIGDEVAGLLGWGTLVALILAKYNNGAGGAEISPRLPFTPTPPLHGDPNTVPPTGPTLHPPTGG